MKQIKKLVDRIKPYQLACSYGTRKGFWTLKEATGWIKYCGSVVVIGRFGKVVAHRIQQRVS